MITFDKHSIEAIKRMQEMREMPDWAAEPDTPLTDKWAFLAVGLCVGALLGFVLSRVLA